MRITKAQFLAERAARRGVANPERIQNETWTWVVERCAGAFGAAMHWNALEARGGAPGFAFMRFGRTTTPLPDGRVICIGGEYEDHYDPDFYIYNDVVEFDAEGHCLAIYGYPVDAFPPTDFHTAALMHEGGAAESIVIVGALGYPSERESGVTPVHRLSLHDWSIERLETTGQAPGWVYKHGMQRIGSRLVVWGGEFESEDPVRRNVDSFALDFPSLTWKRLTHRPYQEWVVGREDRARFALDTAGSRLIHAHVEAMGDLVEVLPEEPPREDGFDGEFALGETELELDRTVVSEDGTRVPRSCIELSRQIGEVRVRLRKHSATFLGYLDNYSWIRVSIEGALSPDETMSIVDDLRSRLEERQEARCCARLRYAQHT